MNENDVTRWLTGLPRRDEPSCPVLTAGELMVIKEIELAARQTADDTLNVHARLAMQAFADRLAKIIAERK